MASDNENNCPYEAIFTEAAKSVFADAHEAEIGIAAFLRAVTAEASEGRPVRTLIVALVADTPSHENHHGYVLYLRAPDDVGCGGTNLELLHHVAVDILTETPIVIVPMPPPTPPHQRD